MRDVLDRLRFYRSVLTDDMQEHARRDYNKFQDILGRLQAILGEMKGWTILDVGCGRRYPLTLQLGSFGNAVTGIDMVYIGLGDSIPERYMRDLRQNGVLSVMRRLSHDLLLRNRTYYTALQRLCDFPLTSSSIEVRQMNVESMVFPDANFDIAVSSAVFEHVARVPNAVSELARVLKPGGHVHLFIHLFPSLSGGHHPDYLNPGKVPPWDHLRQKKCAVPYYLNELRERDYVALFGGKFDIISVSDVYEGEGCNLLTPQIRAELADYSEEELLKRGINIVARRR